MQTSGAMVIRMDGVFDVPAAKRLARELAATDEHEQVRVDLTQVREFHDYGVTVLAQALSARGAHIDVRGLGRHQRRLLRYFGVITEEPEAAAAAEAAKAEAV
jgi:hypothetical protein